MNIEILTHFLSAIVGALGTIGIFGLFPSLITNHLNAIHQHRNTVLLEDIKKENQIILSNLQAQNTVELERLRTDYQKELEGHKARLQNVARYSEYQFKLYNELWTSLYDLKITAQLLWEHASNRNLSDFAKQLKETRKQIEQNILLINEEHYHSLLNILETFEKYRVGKVELISYRHRVREGNIDTIGRDELEFINFNEQVKDEYINLVHILAYEFKRTLKVEI